jgi:hypothetical protein
MAHDGHIRHENYEFTDIKGLAPTSSYILDLRFRDLDPMVYGRHTLKTALSGNILEFTYIGGPVPSVAMSHSQIFHPGSQMPKAQGELTQGMASTGHILLGNCKVIHANGSMPITSFYLTQKPRFGDRTVPRTAPPQQVERGVSGHARMKKSPAATRRRC